MLKSYVIMPALELVSSENGYPQNWVSRAVPGTHIYRNMVTRVPIFIEIWLYYGHIYCRNGYPSVKMSTPVRTVEIGITSI